jgi:hypothetical protein
MALDPIVLMVFTPWPRSRRTIYYAKSKKPKVSSARGESVRRLDDWSPYLHWRNLPGLIEEDRLFLRTPPFSVTAGTKTRAF